MNVYNTTANFIEMLIFAQNFMIFSFELEYEKKVNRKNTDGFFSLNPDKVLIPGSNLWRGNISYSICYVYKLQFNSHDFFEEI